MVGEELDVEKAHRLSHTVEDTVKAEVSGLESLVVHIEPVKREKHRIAVPIDVDKGLGSEISPHFGTAKFFIFIDLIPQGIQSWFVKPNHLIDLEKKRGIVLSETLLGEKITTVISNELGEGPFYMLRDNYVTTYRGESGLTVREVIALFLSGKLKPVLIEDKKSLDHVE
jgi:predicted Fe-Mo cluster-binding NifX family protein